MEHRFNARISRRQVAKALDRLVVKILGVRILLFFIVGFFVLAFDLLDGKVGYLTVVVASIFFAAVLAAIFLKTLLMRGLIKGSGSAVQSSVSYLLDERRISMTSSFGDSEVEWASIGRLWVESELTILFPEGGSCTIIPTQQIPKEALQFLTSQASKFDILTLSGTR